MNVVNKIMTKSNQTSDGRKRSRNTNVSRGKPVRNHLQWIVDSHQKRGAEGKINSKLQSSKTVRNDGIRRKQDSNVSNSSGLRLQESVVQTTPENAESLKLAAAKADIAKMWAEKAAKAQLEADRVAAAVSTTNSSNARERTARKRDHSEYPSKRSSRARNTSTRRNKQNTNKPRNTHLVEYSSDVEHLIPLRKLHDAQIITPAAPRSLVAEQYRAVKRPILNFIDRESRTEEENSNVVMVTSCLSGEGKTYSAVNLAMSIAMERDRTVLLVDADIMKASTGKLLELNNNSYGLIDLILDDDPCFERAVYNTNVEKLQLMPAGMAHENSSEILASSQMANLVSELARQNPDRIIIFDAPPLLLTSEAAALAGQVGQIVFVVSAVSTPQSLVSDALEQLDTNARIGLMLNKAPTTAATGMYGYGYGYGYGDRKPVAGRNSIG